MAVSERNIKRFSRAVKALDKVIEDCRSDDSDCFVYLDGSHSLQLMDGSVGVGDIGVTDTIITCEKLNAGGGDW